MTEQKQNRTRMVIFSRPIQINENTIYGMAYIKETEQRNRENGHDIEDYVAYLVGCELFLKGLGKISDDGRLWTYPDGIHEVLYNNSLQRLLGILLRDMVKIEVLEFDNPIEWNEGELDDESGLILDAALIDRYTKEGVGK